jgi:hypothetical protein
MIRNAIDDDPILVRRIEVGAMSLEVIEGARGNADFGSRPKNLYDNNGGGSATSAKP